MPLFLLIAMFNCSNKTKKKASPSTIEPATRHLQKKHGLKKSPSSEIILKHTTVEFCQECEKNTSPSPPEAKKQIKNQNYFENCVIEAEENVINQEKNVSKSKNVRLRATVNQNELSLHSKKMFLNHEKKIATIPGTTSGILTKIKPNKEACRYFWNLEQKNILYNQQEKMVMSEHTHLSLQDKKFSKNKFCTESKKSVIDLKNERIHLMESVISTFENFSKKTP